VSALNNPIFQDADKARAWLEAHLWTDGPICGHCGTVDNATAMASRPGLYQCNAPECRKQFTVTVGTLFERSHIPLNKWLLAAFLICSSKKGISAHQMHRMFEITYKSAWFMMHRIRAAMAEGAFPGPIGGENKVVEADETFVGGKAKNRAFKPEPKKTPVLALVERGGSVRSFRVANVAAKTLRPFLVKNASRKSHLMTDENLLRCWSRVRRPHHGQSLQKGIRPPRRFRPHQHRGELFFNSQTRHRRHVSPCQPAAP